MRPTRESARRILLFYLLMGLPGPLSLLYLPSHFVVSGDAAATAHRIADGLLIYRFIVVADLVSPIFFLILAWSLYYLFEDVDRKQARLLVTFVVVSSTLGFLDVVLLLAPLVVQSGASFLSVFSKPQLDALTLGLFRVRDELLGVDQALWGLWLLPFGILVVKSGFIPKVIGVLLIIGCFAWLALSGLSVVAPHAHRLSDLIFPLTAPGELSVVLWLIFRSVTGPPAETELAYAK